MTTKRMPECNLLPLRVWQMQSGDVYAVDSAAVIVDYHRRIYIMAAGALRQVGCGVTVEKRCDGFHIDVSNVDHRWDRQSPYRGLLRVRSVSGTCEVTDC